jgi:hypothetical protein
MSDRVKNAKRRKMRMCKKKELGKETPKMKIRLQNE